MISQSRPWVTTLPYKALNNRLFPFSSREWGNSQPTILLTGSDHYISHKRMRHTLKKKKRDSLTGDWSCIFACCSLVLESASPNKTAGTNALETHTKKKKTNINTDNIFQSRTPLSTKQEHFLSFLLFHHLECSYQYGNPPNKTFIPTYQIIQKNKNVESNLRSGKHS